MDDALTLDGNAAAGQLAELPPMLFGLRPQSRSAGVVDGSLFTRVGPIHVTPPSVDL